MSGNIDPVNEEVMETEEEKSENEEKRNKIEQNGAETETTEIIEECDEKPNGNTMPQEELEALNDKYIRLYAEYDNFRKRTVKEKDEIYSSAAADVLKNIFPVLDSFERALQFSGEANEPEKVLEGLRMIETQFLNALEKLGVTEIKSEGERFDPELHNAVFHENDDSQPDNTVTEVLQKGYIKGDKVLRAAMVKVVN